MVDRWEELWLLNDELELRTPGKRIPLIDTAARELQLATTERDYYSKRMFKFRDQQRSLFGDIERQRTRAEAAELALSGEVELPLWKRISEQRRQLKGMNWYVTDWEKQQVARQEAERKLSLAKAILDHKAPHTPECASIVAAPADCDCWKHDLETMVYK